MVSKAIRSKVAACSHYWKFPFSNEVTLESTCCLCGETRSFQNAREVPLSQNQLNSQVYVPRDVRKAAQDFQAQYLTPERSY
jgi:hypothetical protein